MPGKHEWLCNDQRMVHILTGTRSNHRFQFVFSLFSLVLLLLITHPETRIINNDWVENDLINRQSNMVSHHRDHTGGDDEEDEENPEEGWAYICYLIPIFIGILILMEYLHRSAVKKKRRPPPTQYFRQYSQGPYNRYPPY